MHHQCFEICCSFGNLFPITVKIHDHFLLPLPDSPHLCHRRDVKQRFGNGTLYQTDQHSRVVQYLQCPFLYLKHAGNSTGRTIPSGRRYLCRHHVQFFPIVHPGCKLSADFSGKQKSCHTQIDHCRNKYQKHDECPLFRFRRSHLADCITVPCRICSSSVKFMTK